MRKRPVPPKDQRLRWRATRKRYFLSIDDMAKIVGVNEMSYYRYEFGRVGPDDSTLAAIEQIIGTLDDLTKRRASLDATQRELDLRKQEIANERAQIEREREELEIAERHYREFLKTKPQTDE